MKFSDNSMCAILLCSYLGIKKEDSLKPLSMKEWNQFLDKMIALNCEPQMVLHDGTEILNKMSYPAEYIERLEKLLSRGGILAFELDALERKGINIVTMFDTEYPVLLKRRLKRKIPPVLYYAGDIKLAGKIGICVVGSRRVDEEGMEFTQRLVEKAVSERLVIYSGGAKGVDTISEKTAVNNGGAVVSFIADSLISRIKKKDVLENIIKGKLLLVSDIKPDAGFSAARAMNRNKYIYTSAYGAFVVASEYKKGGTWSGAVETLKNNWINVYVWNHKEYSGNGELILRGGIPYILSEEKIYDLITKKKINYNQMDLFKLNQIAMVTEEENHYGEMQNDLYHIVKEYIMNQLGDGLDINNAAQKFNIAKGQMKTWLKRLETDKLVKCEGGKYIKI